MYLINNIVKTNEKYVINDTYEKDCIDCHQVFINYSLQGNYFVFWLKIWILRQELGVWHTNSKMIICSLN